MDREVEDLTEWGSFPSRIDRLEMQVGMMHVLIKENMALLKKLREENAKALKLLMESLDGELDFASEKD